jgi:hypothetical protein
MDNDFFFFLLCLFAKKGKYYSDEKEYEYIKCGGVSLILKPTTVVLVQCSHTHTSIWGQAGSKI